MKRDYSTMLSETWFRLLLRLYPRDFREEMGEAGLKRARELFSEDRYVCEVASLYESLAPNRPDRS